LKNGIQLKTESSNRSSFDRLRMNGIVAEDTYQGNSEKVVSSFEKGGLRGICKFKSLSISPVSGTGQALYERERNVLIIQSEKLT
jgi:hypothetical protein